MPAPSVFKISSHADAEAALNQLYALLVTNGPAKTTDGVNAALDPDAVASAAIEDGSVTAAKLAANAVESAKIADGAVTLAKLASGAGMAAMAAAGVGQSAAYDKTTNGAQTLIAANANGEGARVVLLIVHVDEVFADGDTTQTAFTFGETDTADKYADATLLADAALDGVFVLAGELTEEKALLVTGTAAAGTGTGGVTVTAIVLPAAV